MSEAETLRAQLRIAREALVEAERFAATPYKWRSHIANRLRDALRLALLQSEPAPPAPAPPAPAPPKPASIGDISNRLARPVNAQPAKVEKKRGAVVDSIGRNQNRKQDTATKDNPRGWQGNTFRNG